MSEQEPGCSYDEARGLRAARGQSQGKERDCLRNDKKERKVRAYSLGHVKVWEKRVGSDVEPEGRRPGGGVRRMKKGRRGRREGE